jgi:hypothetical protein
MCNKTKGGGLGGKLFPTALDIAENSFSSISEMRVASTRDGKEHVMSEQGRRRRNLAEQFGGRAEGTPGGLDWSYNYFPRNPRQGSRAQQGKTGLSGIAGTACLAG